MKNIAIEFIEIIENHGFKAYIVGGFVRDYLMNIKSTDIDITTSATPKEIKEIFPNVKFPKVINDDDSYGSVRVVYKNILFEVTTFRKEEEYFDNRHPSRIYYVDDLLTDLKRRDFTINAICMSKTGEILDPLNGISDLKNKKIKTIKNSQESFTEDALRILRAIRFKTVLNFSFDEEIKESIEKTKHLLKNISYERKRCELDKIFGSLYAKNGINLLKDLDLIEELEIKNIDKIKDYTDLIGIWSMINSSVYKFTRHEKDLIKKVNIVYELDNLDPKVLYQHGLYVNVLAGSNKGINKKEITKRYQSLPIKSRKDIKITASEICEILNQKPSSFLNKIYLELENAILNRELENNNVKIKEYVKNHFKTYEKTLI